MSTSKVKGYLPLAVDRLTLMKYAAGVIVAVGISLLNIGLVWTSLVGFSAVAVILAYRSISDSCDDRSTSFDDLYSASEDTAKQKRMLAKKKEKHDRKQRASLDSEDDSFTSQQNSERSISTDLFEYSMSEDCNGGFTQHLSPGDMRRRIPSLRSPQPLLSAVKSRICIRDAERQRPIHPFGNKYYDKSPRREVLRNVQNESLMRSFHSPQSVKNSLFMSNESVVKSVLPPSGKYFSRINPEQGQSNISLGMMTPFYSPIQGPTQSDLRRTGTEIVNDTCSKEAVVKALQEKTASKRKRTAANQSETIFDIAEDFEKSTNKKRRLADDATSSAFGEPGTSKLKGYIKKRFINRSLVARPPMKTVSENKVGKGDEVNQKIKYGVDDNDINLLADDTEEQMEAETIQNKRKANVPNVSAKKGKQEVKTPKKKAAASITKKTPVKSVETQTLVDIAKDGDAKKGTDSPRTPLLKTPFKKIFSSGFPSNLKAGSTEKRRRIPIYCTSAGDLETIEIAREEYGERGVSYAAYQADRKEAAERVKALIAGDDDDETSSPVPTSVGFGTATTTSSLLNSLTDEFNSKKVVMGSTTLGPTSSTAASLNFTQPLMTEMIAKPPSESTATASRTLSFAANSDAGKVLNSAQSVVPSAPCGSITATTASQSIGSLTAGSSIQTAFKPSGFSLISSTTTNVVEPVKPTGFSLAAASPANTFGLNTPSTSSSVASTGGFSLSSLLTSSVTASPSASAVTNTMFQFGAASPALPSGTQPAKLPNFSAPQSQATSAQGGGFSFSSVDCQKQQEVTKPFSVAPQRTQSVATDPPKPAAFSFGSSSGQAAAPSGFSFGNTSTSAHSVPNSTTTQSAAGIASFGFNLASTASSTAAASGANVFGFTPASSTQPASQSTSGFSLGAATTTNSQAGFGGFSFGAGTTAKTQSVFSFGNPTQAANTNASQTQKPDLSFAAAPVSQQPSSVFPAATTTTSSTANIFGTHNSASVFGGAILQASIAPTSLFGAAPAVSASIFGSASQPAKAPAQLFGVPTQSSSSSKSLFGKPTQNSSAASLFGTQTQQANTAAPFATSNAPASFSFGGQSNNLFGAAVSQAPAAAAVGGFSFSNSAQSTPVTTTQGLFGQSATSSSTSFGFGKSASNPFNSKATFGKTETQPTTTASFAFGQTAPPNFTQNAQPSFGQTVQPAFGQPSQPAFGGTAAPAFGGTAAPAFGGTAAPAFGGTAAPAFGGTTAPAFGGTAAPAFGGTASPAFGQTAQPAFGQPSQPAFGGTAAPAFGTSSNQNQSGGFNFAASQQTPASFSFRAGAGGVSGGFASRPGTPTPTQSAIQAPGAIFGTPQPQGAGFTIGAGNAAAPRQQIKARRRARK